MNYLKKMLILACFTFCFQLWAQDRQTGIFQYPDGTFAAGVKSLDFVKAVYKEDKQRQDLWCWATSVAMVLRFQGINVSQEDVVYQALNGLINQPGNGMDMVRGANGWSVQGKTIKAWFEKSCSAKQIIDDLAYKYPLVVGIDNPGSKIGHAYVLTAIFFNGDKEKNIYPVMVTLRDPWPGSPDRLEMSWDEFTRRVNTFVHITY
jgi:hypothetical protein